MRRPLCTYCLFFAAVMFVIVLCVPPPAFSLGEWAGEETVLQGSVTQKEESEKGQVLYLTDVTFCDGDFQHLQIENMGVICYMESNEESGGDLPALGSYVKISGTVQEFSMATNPGEFDMKEYYQISGYHFRVVGGKTDALLLEGSPWKEGLYRLRKYLEKQADAVFGEASSILSAMLLGDKKGMDAEIKELYQVAGIAHVLAISGVNTLNLVSLSKSQMPNLRAFSQVLLRKYTLFYQQILSGFCPLVVLPLFRGCFSKLTKWQKEYLFAKV